MPGRLTADVNEQASWHAALSICEALILAPIENGSLSADQACGLLGDAAAAHRHAPAGPKKSMHELAAAAIETIQKQVSVAAIPHPQVSVPKLKVAA